MRNLKKFLALVLAMAMAFSLMLSASAATALSGFKDETEVTSEFVEAVSVLVGLDVIKGDGDEDNKTIRPKDDITRAEAAALVYRIATGDINDRQVQLYSDYGKFTDVNSGDWFAGYVGYCQNAGIIKGTSPTTFSPYQKVSGYEVLAMILRAVGYGKNNEFTGSDWQVNVASLAKTKHITDSVTSTHFNYTLNMSATREIVAELLFRGSMIPQVTWSSALGYNDRESVITVNDNWTYNKTLAQEVFGLYLSNTYGTDNWGRPQLVWMARYNPTSEPARTVATLTYQPKETITTLMRECDVADLLDIKTEETYDLYVNSKTVTAEDYRIVATDTVTKVGGQGRVVEIFTQEHMNTQFPFHQFMSYWATEDGDRAPEDRIIMIDTVLAKVTGKADAVKDAAGHVITPAKLYVNVYDREQAPAGSVTPNPSTRIISKPAGNGDNWDDYSTGSMLLLNARTNKSARTTQAAKERAAFETDVTVSTTTGSTSFPANTIVSGTDVWITGTPTSKDAKQTLIYWNQEKHNIDNKDEMDALTFYLDVAGTTTNTTFRWYFDKYDNLIGVDNVGDAVYGVITSIYAAYKTNNNNNTDGGVQAIASVLYSDGTTGTEIIDRFLVSNEAGKGQGDNDPDADWGPVTTEFGKEAMIDTTSGDANALELVPVYDANGDDPLTVIGAGVSFAKRHADKIGWLNLAPQAVRNQAMALDPSGDEFGILYDHMFKFVKSANDETTAIQVAGYKANPAEDHASLVDENGDPVKENHSNAENTGVYEWLYNGYGPGASPANDGDAKLVKSTGALNVVTKDGGDAKYNFTIWADSETQIIVQNQDDVTKHSAFKGLSSLPGTVEIKGGSEVMWADPDGDGRAEYIFVTGRISGVITYGLVYFDALRDHANWNGTTGTMEAYLNGERTTLTFNDEELFNAMKNTTGYAANLFAVERFNGIVSDVLVADVNKDNEDSSGNAKWCVELLWNVNANGGIENTDGQILGYVDGTFPGNDLSLEAALQGNKGAGYFLCGNDYGNAYEVGQTRVIYFDDSTSGTDLTYVEDPMGDYIVGGQIGGTAATFYFTPNTKRIGNMNYLNTSAKNDVTIVYDDSSKAIMEIYVATDPNITPSEETPSNAATRPGANVTDLSGITYADAAALQSAINAAGTGVFYNSNVTATAGGTTAPKEALYFAFTATGSSQSIITLQIWDSSNTLVYAESITGTSLAVGGHCFAINFTKQGAVADGSLSWYTTPGLVAGETYRYTITGNNVISTSGSFSMTR